MGKNVDAALRYAALGWQVFPLAERDKVPAVAGGFKVATCDEEQIVEAWRMRPDMNVGIATGCGLMVIDLDVDDERGEDGNATLRAWEKEHGELPETATAITGSGGTHLFYTVSEPVYCSVDNDLGVDIRAEGGYVVAPPSIHPCGMPYEWELPPEEVGVARADKRVMEFVRFAQQNSTRGRRERFKLPDTIGAGARNDTLMRYACSMQARGDDDALILAALQGVNQLRCDPPLSDEEVLSIVKSATSYEKGNAKPRQREAGDAPTLADPGVALMLKKDGSPQQTIENCCRVLEGDGMLAGRFYYDERAYTRMICGPVPWDDREGERAIGDADYCGLAAYLERAHGLMSKQKATDAVICVSMRNRRNLVAEWLDSLVWDGEPRIHALLPAFLGCDVSDYNVEAMRLFMLGAVARAYEPGTKFDYMLVLIGKQGLGKSYFLRLLGHESDWYCDNLNTIDGDAAAEKLRGMWVVEMAELLATKRSKDVEGIKAFITSTVDTIRPKYARETEQRPRACVFAGTTNDAQFLTDSTGNRRFLPIECGVHEPAMSLFDGNAQAFFDQAWAEAAHIWKTERPRLVLSDTGQAYAIAKQENYTEDDPKVGLIQQFLDERLCEARGAGREDHLRVCAQEIIENALPDMYARGNEKMLVHSVHSIMATSVVGWRRHDGKARCGDYGVQRCYVPIL